MKTRVWLMCGLLALLPTVAQGQTIHRMSDGVASGSLTTAGSDCSVETRCFAVDVRGLASWTVDATKGTSNTLVWEVRSSATGTWRAYPGGDDINGAATATTDGLYLFTNAGYSQFRVRASAISGTTALIVRSGVSGVKSTASIAITSAADASAANQTNGGQKTQIVDGSGNVIGATSNALDVNIKSGASSDTTVSLVDGSASSATNLSVGGGVVSAANPSWTPGNHVPFSFTEAGLLRTTSTATTTDADDASIAIEQNNANSNALAMAFDGSVWRRVTFGTAGTASSQVWTVQGITDMTPLTVSDSSGTDLNDILSAMNPDASAGDAAKSTGPQIMGRYASAPSDVDDGDAAQVLTDIKGRIVLGATTNYIGKTRATDGTNDALIDPCTSGTKTTTAISATADAVIATAGGGSTKNYICSVVLVAAAAEIINIVEGDSGTTCTNPHAIIGSTTEANGLSLAANGGFSAIGGSATIAAGTQENHALCLLVNGSNRVSGFVTWVQR